MLDQVRAMSQLLSLLVLNFVTNIFHNIHYSVAFNSATNALVQIMIKDPIDEEGRLDEERVTVISRDEQSDGVKEIGR